MEAPTDHAQASKSARSTVVVITRNRRDELLRTLEHMTTLPDAAPIITMDNASTDGTAEAIETHFPHVAVMRCATNLGAEARNIAVDRITTRYVAFCDDDTRWQPGSLTAAADLLDDYPGIAAVMGRCLVEPDLREDPLTPELRNSPIPAPAWMPGTALLSLMAATTMFRVDPFRSVGGFSPQLWLGGEEELLSIDLVVRGWWLCWVENVLIHHAPSRSRNTCRRRQLGIRNTLWTTWLRRTPASALRRTANLLSTAPKDRYTLSAIVEALGKLPWVVKERRVVPPTVEQYLRLLEEPQRHSAARRYVG